MNIYFFNIESFGRLLKHVRMVRYLLLNHALTKTGTKSFMIIDENSDDEL